MTDSAEIHALTTSIGEHSVDRIGKENILGLQVYLDVEESLANVTIALRDNSSKSQRDALAALIDVEQLFFDEAVLSFHFVDDTKTHGDARVAQAHYSFA